VKAQKWYQTKAIRDRVLPEVSGSSVYIAVTIQAMTSKAGKAGGVEPPVPFSTYCNYRKILPRIALARKCEKKSNSFGSRSPPSSNAFIKIIEPGGILSDLQRRK